MDEEAIKTIITVIIMQIPLFIIGYAVLDRFLFWSFGIVGKSRFKAAFFYVLQEVESSISSEF